MKIIFNSGLFWAVGAACCREKIHVDTAIRMLSLRSVFIAKKIISNFFKIIIATAKNTAD